MYVRFLFLRFSFYVCVGGLQFVDVGFRGQLFIGGYVYFCGDKIYIEGVLGFS